MASTLHSKQTLTTLRYPRSFYYQSTASDSHVKTVDFSLDFHSPRNLKDVSSSLGRISDLSVREQRQSFLDAIVLRCTLSIRKEDQKVKKDLEREQHRVESLLKDMSKPERAKFYHYNAQSRRKFLSSNTYVSRDEVRRLMADNRIKLKQVRHLAIQN